MMRYLLCTFIFCIGFSNWSIADVYYLEEVVNPGTGSNKKGHRKTINKVYIKGLQQKVESFIETDKKTVKAMKKMGQPLNSSVILQLDKKDVYEFDLDKFVFLKEKIPLPVKDTAKAVAKKSSSNIKKEFSIKETKEEKVIAGIKCRKVMAKMVVSYRDPKSKKPVKQNRYLYTAWLAKEFPGYKEILSFQKKHEEQTSYPALVSGSLEQLKNTIEDYENLAGELDKLEGFVVRSTLKATIKRSKKKEIPVFQLDREIKEYRYASLADSIFHVPKKFTKIGKR